MSMNPRITTDKLRDDYLNYISSILSVKDSKITSLAHEAVRRAEFVKGPYLETTLPFQDGKSLKELVEEGLLSSEFEKMGRSVHYSDWKLRIHQEQALRKSIQDKCNIVVSTGTGSGKTECYLYPVFDYLMKEKQAGTLGPGVRALLLFPMNALANDQQKKLRKLLKNYPDITFGRYTGETPHINEKESVQDAENRLHKEYDANHADEADKDLCCSIPNEYMSREKMIESPPHILLTNYAMLEYLLLQPNTSSFFDGATAAHWHFIVIDEAHTYKGATGAEISFLLRRLKERICANSTQALQCIATSATLGDENEKDSLAKFAATLFGEPFDASGIITTKRKNLLPPKQDSFTGTPEYYARLKEETKSLDENEKGIHLYDSLYGDSRIYALYDALKGAPKCIEDVAKKVFPDIYANEQEPALIDLIELAAAARKSSNDAALLPARYHLFIKSLEGMFVQLYPRKTVFLDRRELISEEGRTYRVFELANCQHCHQEYIVGQKQPENGILVQSAQAEDPDFFLMENSIFKKDADALENAEALDEDDQLETPASFDGFEKYNFCLACGALLPYAAVCDGSCCNIADPKKIVSVYRVKYRSKHKNCCPCCGATGDNVIKRFLTANQPATFAIAKSLYDAVPARPVRPQTQPVVADSWFFDEPASANPTIIDESGRKLLIFSDNRQEAAFFAGFFEKKYRFIMWRRVILKVLKEAGEAGLTISSLIDRVKYEADKASLYSAKEKTDDEKSAVAAKYVMYEFWAQDAGTGLEGLGYVKIFPDEVKGLSPRASIAGKSGTELWNIFRYMMDTLRKKGATSFPSGLYKFSPEDDFFSPRNNYYAFRKDGTSKSGNITIFAFMPAEARENKRSAYLRKIRTLHGKEEKQAKLSAREDLNTIYDHMIIPMANGTQPYFKTIKPQNNAVAQQVGTVYQLNCDRWRMAYIPEEAKVFQCDTCGKLFTYQVDGLCPEMKCTGHLKQVIVKEVRNDAYSRGLLENEQIIPMEAREHTAQLSSETAGIYQKEFEAGNINVLSCSTTFEMGVDVGELEATFLRNVPPETANYIQRAGRAGRRTSSAAFCVTYARRASHDMTFYQKPEKIIAGKVRVPALEIKNEKIAERHLNSIVVSWFFKKMPEYFKGNAGVIAAVDGGENMADALYKCLQERPKELLAHIHHALPEDICEKLQVDEWKFADALAGTEGTLTFAVKERFGSYHQLMDYRNTLDSTTQFGLKRIAAIQKVAGTLKTEKSISFLAAKGILPKYGFPVDSVSLNILSTDTEESRKIDLSRDLKLAIGEFAPPAAVVANGRVWTSYALNTMPDRGWPTYVYHECPKCQKIDPPTRDVVDVSFDLHEAEKVICQRCHVQMNAKKFVIPMFGFSTKIDEKPKLVGESRPKTYYSTQVQFWGLEERSERERAEAKEKTINYHGKSISLIYSPGGKMFILNQGTQKHGFYICKACGYAVDGARAMPKGAHKTCFGKTCREKLEMVSLGHSFSTDILKISLPALALPQYAQEWEAAGKNLMESLLYAILEGASERLDISRSDISGCISYSGIGQDIILFDDTPGGSGFVAQICQEFESVLDAALAKVSGQCGCSEETSCYGCLRNYGNQRVHDELSRGLAKIYLECLRSDKFISESYTSYTESDAVTENIAKRELSNVRQMNLSEVEFSEEQFDFLNCSDALQTLVDEAEADDLDKLQKLLAISKTGNYEDAVVDDEIAGLSEGSVWPRIFWPNSRVALFDDESDYEKLSNYSDWHCFLLNSDLDENQMFSSIHPKMEE